MKFDFQNGSDYNNSIILCNKVRFWNIRLDGYLIAKLKNDWR